MRDQATCHCRPESKVDLHAVEVPCGDVADALNKAFSRAIHDAWQQGYEQAVRDRKPRTITTPAELAEMAKGSVIISHLGGVWTKYYDHFREADNWEAKGSSYLHPDDLPATVLYEPLS